MIISILMQVFYIPAALHTPNMLIICFGDILGYLRRVYEQLLQAVSLHADMLAHCAGSTVADKEIQHQIGGFEACTVYSAYNLILTRQYMMIIPRIPTPSSTPPLHLLNSMGKHIIIISCIV
jgi:ATP adenylyltransferase/5',5'''-P-1,P-4-tetraphosphate phosphorylase II